MIDILDLMRCKDASDQRRIGDRTEHRYDQTIADRGELAMELIDAVLIDIENDQLRRCQLDDGAAKLRPDRSASASHENGAIFHGLVEQDRVGRHWRAA